MHLRDPSSFSFPAVLSYCVTFILEVPRHRMAADAPAITSAFQAAGRRTGAMRKGISLKTASPGVSRNSIFILWAIT